MSEKLKINIGLEKELEIASIQMQGIQVEEIGRLLEYYCRLSPDTRRKMFYMVAGAYMGENPDKETIRQLAHDMKTWG